jgi:hypothetical protein
VRLSSRSRSPKRASGYSPSPQRDDLSRSRDAPYQHNLRPISSALQRTRNNFSLEAYWAHAFWEYARLRTAHRAAERDSSRVPYQRTDLVLRWSGPRPHGRSCHVPAAQSAGGCDGLLGHLPLLVWVRMVACALHSGQDKPGHELLQEQPCISNIPRHDGNAGRKVSSRREMRYSSA